MGKTKDILNQKVSLADMWKSVVLVLGGSWPWSLFFKKKKEATKDLGPLISYKTADVIKLCISKDISSFERLYPNSEGGFEYEMIKKAMANELFDMIVQSNLIEWHKVPSYAGNQLKAEIWVAKK